MRVEPADVGSRPCGTAAAASSLVAGGDEVGMLREGTPFAVLVAAAQFAAQQAGAAQLGDRRQRCHHWLRGHTASVDVLRPALASESIDDDR